MSKALDYLLQTRPQAMKNYFGFLKEAGKHLDPRTRAIISIITKVDNQTDAGFRQYLRRALREGVTADEVLDGLLVAFPSLGLTKIVWAMDILLQMDLPEFRPENLGSGKAWHEVMTVSDLQPGTAVSVRIEERVLFIYTTQESMHVYDNRCPHQGTLLQENNLEGCLLTCPRHHWQFDLTTGECVRNGDLPLVKLEHEVKKGMLNVCW